MVIIIIYIVTKHFQFFIDVQNTKIDFLLIDHNHLPSTDYSDNELIIGSLISEIAE